MALTWVKVVRPDGASGNSDDVYVNGQYVDAAGEIGAPFQVQSGDKTFETLDASGAPDWRKTTLVVGAFTKDQAQLVTLEPVAAGGVADLP